MLGMIERLLHEPRERDRSLATDQVADAVDEWLVGHVGRCRLEAFEESKTIAASNNRAARRRFNSPTPHRFIVIWLLPKFAAKLRAISIPRVFTRLAACLSIITRRPTSLANNAPGTRAPGFISRSYSCSSYVVAGLLAFIPAALSLKQQAAGFDLSHLEQMESASVILDRNNKIFGQIYVENRETVPYDQLPPNLVNAIIATEDNKFYQHHGYDLLGIIRAALKNAVAGHVRQGASTVTQQLARNSFDLKGKTFRRKLLEMFVARRIEDHFSKQQNHGALPEPNLFRRRSLWCGSGGARLFRQAGARDDAGGMRYSGRPDQKP